MLVGQAPGSWIVIDEVQKVPSLLSHVHGLIENQKLRFALSGSSARKLRRAGADMLAGRAFEYHLYPLTHEELGEDFDLDGALNWGALPKVRSYSDDQDKREFLNAYTSTYIREEIKEEQLVRKLPPFLQFLEVAAQNNGTILNFSKQAREAGTDSHAIERYYEILLDTWMGFLLPPFHRSVRKQQTQKSKFYWFDTGVKRAFERSLRTPLGGHGTGYGRAFEHFIILECIRLNDYKRCDYKFSFLRTKDDLEIDLVVERPGKPLLLIEIKSASQVDSHRLGKLKKLKEDLDPCEFWIISQEKFARQLTDQEGAHWVTLLPWREGLMRLFE